MSDKPTFKDCLKTWIAEYHLRWEVVTSKEGVWGLGDYLHFKAGPISANSRIVRNPHFQLSANGIINCCGASWRMSPGFKLEMANPTFFQDVATVLSSYEEAYDAKRK
jgi:hypothetical protein